MTLFPRPGRGRDARSIVFAVVNQSRDVFLHPKPILPSPVTMRWLRDEVEVSRQQQRAMLPLALPGRARGYFGLEVDVPDAGPLPRRGQRAASEVTELASEVVDVEPAGDGGGRPVQPGVSASIGVDLTA